MRPCGLGKERRLDKWRFSCILSRLEPSSRITVGLRAAFSQLTMAIANSAARRQHDIHGALCIPVELNTAGY